MFKKADYKEIILQYSLIKYVIILVYVIPSSKVSVFKKPLRVATGAPVIIHRMINGFHSRTRVIKFDRRPSWVLLAVTGAPVGPDSPISVWRYPPLIMGVTLMGLTPGSGR